MRVRILSWSLGLLITALSLPAIATQAASGKADRKIDGKAGTFKVDSNLALSSLITISDGHLQKAADSFALLATSEAVQSGAWHRIKEPLALAAKQNIEGLYWFGLPDGSYWSLQEGKATGNLSDRDYFPNLMQGDTIIGDLVVSKATGKSSAIVAVPVTNATGKVIGALGVSVYLDKLSERISNEMEIGENLIFYAFNEKPLLSLIWDKSLILVDPTTLSPEVKAAFDEMLSNGEGSVRYQFRGQTRTVRYRKSEVTNWWYALGQVPHGQAPAQAR